MFLVSSYPVYAHRKIGKFTITKHRQKFRTKIEYRLLFKLRLIFAYQGEDSKNKDPLRNSILVPFLYLQLYLSHITYFIFICLVTRIQQTNNKSTIK